ncbi:helix-turn-helix domain-containing protein, partial [Bacteroides sp. OttesenSCG-928-D19]|nr:helix-turn-helix domain-containing protein [Bacteroides sp. OttesenSCG-928-D19]
ALNRCTGKNINTYINEYRIKEAIRIMSDPGYRTLTLDAIADEAGFNDRQNFHRVFKKKTGLSPGVFRKNMDESA